MSLAFRDSSETLNVTGTSIDMAIPGDVQSGDLAYVILGIGSGTTTVTPPSGWDQLSSGDEFPFVSVSRKVLAGGDAGTTATFDVADSATICGVLIAFSGADQTTPEDATATNYALGGQGASIPCPSVDTTIDDDIVLIYGVSGDDVTFGPSPSGFSDGPVSDKVATYYITQASPGASGVVDITQSGASSYYGSGTIAIAPAGGGGGGVALEGTADSGTSAEGTLEVDVPLAGEATTETTSEGTLEVGAALAGEATTETTAEGTLEVDVALAGEATTETTGEGTLEVGAPVALAGESTTETTAEGMLEVVNPSLQGEADTETSAEGTLSVDLPATLQGEAATETSAEGALSVRVPAAGTAATETSAEGTLTAAGTPAALVGTAATKTSAEGALSAPTSTNGVLVSAGFFAMMM